LIDFYPQAFFYKQVLFPIKIEEYQSGKKEINYSIPGIGHIHTGEEKADEDKISNLNLPIATSFLAFMKIDNKIAMLKSTNGISRTCPCRSATTHE